MKTMKRNTILIYALISILSCFGNYQASACSTFKLQKGNVLIYGHNLNNGSGLGSDVSGTIYLNKRGILKIGEIDNEMSNEAVTRPPLCWISKYGSITFNAGGGKDIPDGGMNEAGLFIWEMTLDATDYPKNDKLPRLNSTSWIQCVLDNCSTLEDVISYASEFEIDGRTWHFFIGDSRGNTATIEFIDQKVVVNKGESMPVPNLSNTTYEKDLELLKCYKGFGGQYLPDPTDPTVPRIVKTAVMIRDYNPNEDAVEYGFKILQSHLIKTPPQWSIIFDVRTQKVFFKTNLNPAIKIFSMKDIDFSNASPIMVLDIDIKKGGTVDNQFQPYSNDKDKDIAALKVKPYFNGVWKNKPDRTKDEKEITLKLETTGDAVSGQVIIPKFQEAPFTIDNLHLIGNTLSYTCRANFTFLDVKAILEGDKMKMNIEDVEYGLDGKVESYALFKE